jgi:hypothetical protein
MDPLYSGFPARQNWPEALGDVLAARNDAERIRLKAGARNFRALATISNLKALWCFDIDAAALSAIGNCVRLDSLYVENLKTDDVAPLRELRHLKTLSLDTCSKVKALSFLSGMQSLSSLAIIHFKNVHDLSPLSELVSLRELAVAGSMWTRMQVESFQPLEKLVNLELLHLTNIKAKDESLEPLSSLKRLRRLDIANFYPMREFATLSRRLSGAECTWFQPYIPFEQGYCKKCGRQTMLILTGQRKPQLCESCDRERLFRHVREWNEVAAEAA